MTLVEVMVSLAIAVLTMGAIVSGYIFCLQSTEKAEFEQVASAKALERLEEARSAVWDVSSYPVVDQLVATNFPDETNVTLNLTGAGADGVPATIKTTISDISPTPPMTAPIRRIHVDCIWQFRGTETITTSIETIRAPDQ